MERCPVPRVSIIMAVCNGMPYMREAIASVLAQDMTDWEMIIVNDGSQDATAQFLDALDDSRIRVVHQVNQGVSTARNVALDLARGEFLTLLDADDRLPSGSLSVRTDYLRRHPEVDLVDGCMTHFDATMTVPLSHHTPHYHGELLPRLLRLDSSVFRLPFYLFRRSLVAELRFRSGMTHGEDLLFFVQLAARQRVLYGHVQAPVYHYRTGHGSAMSDLPGLEAGYFTLVSEIGKLPQVNWSSMLLLRMRIARILLLSWLSAGNCRRGCWSALQLLCGSHEVAR